MARAYPTILLSTVLLEPNRWTPQKLPTFAVSTWAPAVCDAGFSGLELWENHAALADTTEQQALCHLPLPITVLNSYCTFDDAGTAGRRVATKLIRSYGVSGVKFNFGNDSTLIGTYQRHLEAWADELPASCRLLCECHAGTVLERPDAAARILWPFAGRVEVIVHPFSGERATLQHWIERFGPAVTHAHVAARQGDSAFVTLEDVSTEACARIGILRAAGFDGTWSIEFTKGVARSPEDRQDLLLRAAADMAFIRGQLSGGTAC